MFKNKNGQIRSGWKIAFMMGAFLAILTIISSVIMLLVTVTLTSKGDLDISTLTYTPHGKQVLKTAGMLMMFLQEIIMILTPVIAWKFIMKRPLSNMGLTPVNKHGKELATGLMFGIVSITIVFIALIISGHAEVVTWKPHFSVNQLIYIFIFIFVGLAEEILGRGYIMSVLRQTKNVPVIVIVSSILFALMHSSNNGIGLLPYINLALVGILFAYMYLRSGNLWMCIGYHITWNYFQGYVYGFKVSGMDADGIVTTMFTKKSILNGGDFGPEGGLFVTGVIIIGFLFVRLYYKNSQFNFLASEPALPVIAPMPDQQIMQQQQMMYQQQVMQQQMTDQQQNMQQVMEQQDTQNDSDSK